MLKLPGKKKKEKDMSSSDGFPLKPTGESTKKKKQQTEAHPLRVSESPSLRFRFGAAGDPGHRALGLAQALGLCRAVQGHQRGPHE